jgi:hypothetical protein
MAEDDLLRQVRVAWAEVLDVDDVEGVPLDTNFLEAGGSSLLLVMLWEELQGLTDQVVKMSDLFQHGTVRAQAALLGGDRPVLTEVGARNRGGLAGRARRTGTIEREG